MKLVNPNKVIVKDILTSEFITSNSLQMSYKLKGIYGLYIFFRELSEQYFPIPEDSVLFVDK